jgi:hypothetical protein
LWIFGTSSIAPWIQIVHIWLCPLPVGRSDQQRYQMEKKNWFPRTDTPEHAAYDKRTPGLFKREFNGNGMIVLCSKT